MLGLKLVQKLPVFRRRVMQQPPVVGETEVYLYDTLAAPGRQLGGEIAALDRKNLSVKWRLRLGEFSPYETYDSRLLIVRDLNAIGVVDVRGPKVVWSREGWARLWGRKLLVGTPTGLDVVEPSTGEVEDSIAVEAIPMALSGDVFVGPVRGGRGVFMAYDLVQRRRVWERDLFQELRTRFGLREPESFGVFSGSLPGRFLANGLGAGLLGCSVEDGAILWKADVDLRYLPLVVGGKIPVMTWNRHFVVIDEATGELLCETKHGVWHVAGMWHGSIFGGGVVFAGGDVALFDLDSGLLLWQGDYKSAGFFGCAVADERVLVPASDGKLWVFEGTDKPERKRKAKPPEWMKQYRRHMPDAS
jgi:outer membrane protein assembly factor BamB